MEDAEAETLARPRKRMRAHWLVFWLLVFVAFLANAAAHTNWATAAGFVAGPAVVGYFIVRGGTTVQNLVGRYVVFAAFLALLVGGDVIRTVEKETERGKIACIERNAFVAQLTREAEKQAFCGCLLERLRWPMAREWGAAFLTFREPIPPQQHPVISVLGAQAADECAATLLAS